MNGKRQQNPCKPPAVSGLTPHKAGHPTHFDRCLEERQVFAERGFAPVYNPRFTLQILGFLASACPCVRLSRTTLERNCHAPHRHLAG